MERRGGKLPHTYINIYLYIYSFGHIRELEEAEGKVAFYTSHV